MPLTDCGGQRNLNDAGRAQARSIGESWRALELPLGDVLSSGYCRTRETAQLAFGRATIVSALTGIPAEMVGTYTGRVRALRRLLGTKPPDGENTGSSGTSRTSRRRRRSRSRRATPRSSRRSATAATGSSRSFPRRHGRSWSSSDAGRRRARALLGDAKVSTSESVLDQHAGDLSYHARHAPDAVVFPESTEDVARVLAWANERGVPVVPFGAGTSLEGHVIPADGGDHARPLAYEPRARGPPRRPPGARAAGRAAQRAERRGRRARPLVPRRPRRRRVARRHGGDERERHDDRPLRRHARERARRSRSCSPTER